MRSPRQVELRAKARGLKIPTEFISFEAAPASRWCGAKTRAPRCPDGTSSRGLSPRHFEAFQKEEMNNDDVT